MSRTRPSDPDPDLGSLSVDLTSADDERRSVQVGLAVAVVLHAVFFAVTWPSLAGGERVATERPPRIFVLQQVQVELPEPAPIQLPEPPRRTVVIPDQDPDAPEPELRHEPMEVAGLEDTDWVPFAVPAPPPEEEVPEGPVLVGVDIQAPRILTKVDPRYTESARAVRKQGAVVLELLIDEQGAVAEITVLRGLPLGLTESAVDAVRQWRFEPSTLRGRPVAVRYTLTVHFRLE